MSADLVRVCKAGEVLAVHPTCLPAHLAAGWSVVTTPVEDDAPDQPATPPDVDGAATAADKPKRKYTKRQTT